MPILHIYVFQREAPIIEGRVEDRDKYFVYAYDQIEAFAKYDEENPEQVARGYVPKLLGRIRT